MRLQLALNVNDIDEAVDFYARLFDAEPAGRKPGYASFSIENPPLELVLVEDANAGERLDHLGVEVSETESESVTAATERLKTAGLAARGEGETTCCDARQDELWAVDPQGLRWELHRVLADGDTFGGDADAQSPGGDDASPAAVPPIPGDGRLEACC